MVPELEDAGLSLLLNETASLDRFDLHLSGHTHGGQICLPGGIPLIRNGNCPKEMIAGAWRYGKMHGYTSRGTGCCGVAARFFCPPEITVHTLRRTASEVPEPQKKDA